MCLVPCNSGYEGRVGPAQESDIKGTVNFSDQQNADMQGPQRLMITEQQESRSYLECDFEGFMGKNIMAFQLNLDTMRIK